MLFLSLLEGPVAANSGNIQGIVARISTLEINTTAEHLTVMTAIEANQQRISALQSTTNDSKILYKNMELRLNNLEGTVQPVLSKRPKETLKSLA